jgi:hypothetical protein
MSPQKKKAASAPVPARKHAAGALIGKRVRFEGYDYKIVSVNEPRPGFVRFEREKHVPKRNGTYKGVTGNTADVTDARKEDDFDFYLPGRCAPLLAPRLTAAVEEGLIDAEQWTAIRDAIALATKGNGGRDDLAEAQVTAAFGIKLPKDVPATFVAKSILPPKKLNTGK